MKVIPPAMALLTTTLSLCAIVGAHAQGALVISGATVIGGPGGAPIRNAVVVIEGSRIVHVGAAEQIAHPANARVLDGTGKYLIPGLADMHIHPGNGYTLQIQALAQRPNFGQDLAQLLAWGFTTAFSTSGPALDAFTALRSVANRDDSPTPRLFGVGMSFTAKGGHASRLGAFTPDTPDEARTTVRTLKAAKVDAIKLIYDDMASVRGTPIPMMKPEVMQAIIDEAHAQELKAYVHALSLGHAKEALRAGADGLVHAVVSGPVDDEFIALMKKNRAVYVTTHSLFNALADIAAWMRKLERSDERGTVPKEIYERYASADGIRTYHQVMPKVSQDQLAVIRTNLRRVHDARIPVVAGTDTSVPGVVLGVSSRMELALLVEDGLKPEDALRAATINAARMLGREQEQGTIEPGKLADLVILDADPLADIRNVGRIHRVIKGGVAYDPGDLSRAGK